MVKPYSRRRLTREERITNYRISRGSKLAENVFGILGSRFRVLLDTMEQRPKVTKKLFSKIFKIVFLANLQDIS